jgi:hypothetical protein
VAACGQKVGVARDRTRFCALQCGAWQAHGSCPTNRQRTAKFAVTIYVGRANYLAGCRRAFCVRIAVFTVSRFGYGTCCVLSTSNSPSEYLMASRPTLSLNQTGAGETLRRRDWVSEEFTDTDRNGVKFLRTAVSEISEPKPFPNAGFKPLLFNLLKYSRCVR